MIQIKWKIGKKKQGNYLTPLDFEIWLLNSEGLKYNPDLFIPVRYKLPDRIYFSKVNINPDGRMDSDSVYGYLYKGCSSIDTISFIININAYAAYLTFKDDSDRLLIGKLKPERCYKPCESCRAYLPWRPGVPDYSDFEAVFMQMAYDLCKEWDQEVMEAREYHEYEGELVTITSENYLEKISIKRRSYDKS